MIFVGFELGCMGEFESLYGEIRADFGGIRADFGFYGHNHNGQTESSV